MAVAEIVLEGVPDAVREEVCDGEMVGEGETDAVIVLDREAVTERVGVDVDDRVDVALAVALGVAEQEGCTAKPVDKQTLQEQAIGACERIGQ